MLNPLRMRSALLLAGVVAALVGLAVLTVAGLTHTAQQRAARQQLDNRAALVSAAAADQLNRYVDALSMAAAGLAAARPVTATAFTRVTAPLRELGLSGVPSVAFVVPARDDQIAATQARWRSRGATGLELVANRDVHVHLFAVLNRTIDGTEPPRLGGDSTRAPAAAAAMRQAGASGRVTVSAPYQLLRDQALPSRQRQVSFVLAAAVRDGADGPLQGWVVISLRGQDFITATLQEFAQDLVDVTLWVRDTDRRAVTVAGLRATDPSPRDLHRALDLEVAQTHWNIQIDATAARLPGVHSALPVATGVVGALIALLAAVLITGRARADRRVRVATAELVRNANHLHIELGARYAAEAKLREHEAELTAFAGVVAHDLKAPLTVAAGYSHLALSSLVAGASREAASGHLQQVLQATRRMDQLIEDLLRYAAARDGRLDRADIDLRALVDRAVADRLIEYAARPGHPAPHVFVGPLPAIRADASMIRQLLDNLIGNSFKFTQPGQPATLDITAETPETGELRLVVADRGIGIPRDQQDAVFAGFFRSGRSDPYAGSGLGLAICHRIVQRHGGVIAAADNPGGGTRITVTLPPYETGAKGLRSHRPGGGPWPPSARARPPPARTGRPDPRPA